MSLFGSYRLQEQVNNGGLAELWMATDEEGQHVAVRKMHGHLLKESAAPKLFKRGCEILAKLPPHENLVRYLDHGKIQKIPFLAMEYVEGANLKTLMLREDSALGEMLSDILYAMAAGLEHLHDHGVMHLDFKPENVVVSHGGRVLIVDFDTALPIPKKPEKVGKNSGTPGYMAPEQLRGEPLDQRADIFAFGLIAYELLTQRRPFAGDTPEEGVRNILDAAFCVKPPREYNPDIPSEVEQILLKCLQRDLFARWPSMTLVAAKLRRALGVRPVGA
jgi:serine/threonine protein kinase